MGIALLARVIATRGMVHSWIVLQARLRFSFHFRVFSNALLLLQSSGLLAANSSLCAGFPVIVSYNIPTYLIYESNWLGFFSPENVLVQRYNLSGSENGSVQVQPGNLSMFSCVF